MSQRVPVNPGNVEWSGENPGIYLKHEQEGDWATLAIFFRVVLSPHGRGHTLIVLERPDEATAHPEAANLCFTDNETLTRYLLSDFMSKFPSFRGRAGLDGMRWVTLDEVITGGDMVASYSETARGGGIEAVMTWKDMQPPFAVEVGPGDCATGEHDMYSVFLEARDAEVSVDGRRLGGAVMSRQFFGRTMSTAFLAVSETWVTPA